MEAHAARARALDDLTVEAAHLGVGGAPVAADAERIALSLDEARLELRTLAPGDHVVVSGRPRTRAVSDGYRAQVEVVDLESATVERVTPREASPTTAATADTDEAS